MTNNLNMDNKGIINLKPPTSDTDAATKKYVDDNTGSPDLSDYLEKDGTVPMTGNLNINSNKIINLSKPTQNNDAANKDYVDELVHSTTVQPSHFKNEFSYLMSSGSQWTDEIDIGTSFVINYIDDLPPNQGNFHDYNHKVIYMSINKNSQGSYKYKMGMNFYRLTATTNYTLCLEILNANHTLWDKTQISVDKGNSTGLTIRNVSIKKLYHKYTDSKGKTKTIYYHRIIVNFRKLYSNLKAFVYILVNIPLESYFQSTFPRNFSGVYIIAYGIAGAVSNIDPDKVYDYHTAFDVKPTEVVYNVDFNANQKAIRNIKIDANDNTSAATIGQIKSMNSFTINNFYRNIFEEFYDFSNVDSYGINIGSSGVIINSLKPNITIPNKDLSAIYKDGLNVNGYNITFSPFHSSKYILCIE